MERKKNQDIILELQNQYSRRDQQLIQWIKKQDNTNQNILELTRKQTDSAEKQNIIHEKIINLIQKQNNSAEHVKELIESLDIIAQKLVDKKLKELFHNTYFF
jgi:phosphoribosylaminoimidazole-succinocarboxamide synthase